jgi:hypothetical protein
MTHPWPAARGVFINLYPKKDMRILWAILFFAALGLASCGTQQGSNYRKVELEPAGKLELPLDSLTSNQMRAQFFHDGLTGKDYFVFLSKNPTRLLFYGSVTNKLDFVVRYRLEGPNGVGEPCGFYVQSLDSIFLETAPLHFYLTDTSGRVRKTYPLTGQADAQNFPVTYYCTITNQNQVPLQGTRYHFFRWPDGFENDLTVRKRPFLGQMDLATGKVELLPAYYPALYQQYFWSSIIHMDAGITRAPEGFVFNFPGCDSVYAWKDGKSTPHYAASRFITTPIKPVLNVPTTEEGLHRPVIEQQCYAFLAYDPWRQVYYRIAWHPHDDMSNVGNILRIYAEKPCSIIVLDKDLNIIGETMLPRDRYFTMRWFIGPRGLYLSDAHPDNPDLDEDVLSYTLFTLAEKKDG